MSHDNATESSENAASTSLCTYRILAVVTVVAMLAATLLPAPPPDPTAAGAQPGTTPSLCLVCGAFGSADFLLNTVFFMPLGLLVYLASGRRSGLGLAFLTGLALSTAVEAGQLLVPGRYATLGDVIANTLGAGLGGMAARWRPWLVCPRPGPSGRLSIAAGAVAGTVFVLTGWLLAPSPTDERNWVQWTAELGHYASFRGQLLDARLDDLHLSPGRMDAASSEAARTAIRRGAPAAARARLGPPPGGLAPILSLYDDRQQENFLLGQHDDDLVLRVRYRADGLHLRRPELRFRDALADRVVGDTVRLAAWRPVVEPGTDGAAPRDDAYCLAAGTKERCGLGFPPGRGWSLLLHRRGLSAANVQGLDAAWTGLLFLPLGFWSVRRWPTALGILVATGGLLTVSAVTPLLWPGLAEALGAIGGLAAGRLVGRVGLRYRPGS